jgi:cell division septum initiation protein DivIVA
VAELAADPALAGDWDRGEPSPAVEQAAALALLERARQRRVEGGEGADAGALGDAAELAGQAGRRLEALATAGEDRHRELALLDRQASARLDRLRGEGRAALDDTAELAASLRADPASPQPELLRRRRALEGLLAEVPAEAAGAEAAADRLASALAALRQAATPPAAALSAAAEAYFAGDYQGAADRLDALLGGLGGGAATARTRAHALLLRSAARFALAAGGERAPELLDAARADAAACRRADPDLVPPERLFSPRFRELFEAAGEGGG